MDKALLLSGAVLACVCGFTWLALAMKAHWQQVRGLQTPTKQIVLCLRLLGGTALMLSLSLCLIADHISMAVLVWIMSLAVSAMIVAFTLTWRPHWLSLLIVWLPRH